MKTRIVLIVFVAGAALAQSKIREDYTDTNAQAHHVELKRVAVLRPDGGLLRYDVEATAYCSIPSDDGSATKNTSGTRMLDRAALRTQVLALLDGPAVKVCLPAGFDGGTP